MEREFIRDFLFVWCFDSFRTDSCQTCWLKKSGAVLQQWGKNFVANVPKLENGFTVNWCNIFVQFVVILILREIFMGLKMKYFSGGHRESYTLIARKRYMKKM